ncbi:uncharacterized protein B0I36DRAFT_127535 [Microdochium trichocladiopsis]|uniref:Uncharacterized protein n=1 Tax=Microdochium trichocladiopsis TaxID=1682393 RepID=A0A9P9BLW6_9PEZI|nr:uncharacterized protein B0I36DRAFT_127535 [Microdochium trichocladiopsis]KAH7029018.1 hypothetical protein B0I36DRAFT_127535 [Microdochium trichocladiopsis]
MAAPAVSRPESVQFSTCQVRSDQTRPDQARLNQTDCSMPSEHSLVSARAPPSTPFSPRTRRLWPWAARRLCSRTPARWPRRIVARWSLFTRVSLLLLVLLIAAGRRRACSRRQPHVGHPLGPWLPASRKSGPAMCLGNPRKSKAQQSQMAHPAMCLVCGGSMAGRPCRSHRLMAPAVSHPTTHHLCCPSTIFMAHGRPRDGLLCRPSSNFSKPVSEPICA